MDFGIGSFLFAFLAGVLSTLSPCVLPLIPIIKNSGAFVSNWKNEPAENGGNILATSNKKLHNKILKLLKPFTKK